MAPLTQKHPLYISNVAHRVAIECAQDLVIALVMDACANIGTEQHNLRRSKRELDAAIKKLLAEGG